LGKWINRKDELAEGGERSVPDGDWALPE